MIDADRGEGSKKKVSKLGEQLVKYPSLLSSMSLIKRWPMSTVYSGMQGCRWPLLGMFKVSLLQLRT